MTDPALPSAQAPRRRRLLPTPTRRAGLALVVAAALVALAALRPTEAAPVRPTIRPDGLGTVTYGQDQASAVTDLIAVLGTPTVIGTVGESPGCRVKRRQDVRWGILTVSFYDTGNGMQFGGFHWGDMKLRNSSTPHAAPVGPGSPRLANPWNLRIGTRVFSVNSLVTNVRRTFPGAEFWTAPPPLIDPIVHTDTNGQMLNIVLHQRPLGYAVESIWSFRIEQATC